MNKCKPISIKPKNYPLVLIEHNVFRPFAKQLNLTTRTIASDFLRFNNSDMAKERCRREDVLN